MISFNREDTDRHVISYSVLDVRDLPKEEENMDGFVRWMGLFMLDRLYSQTLKHFMVPTICHGATALTKQPHHSVLTAYVAIAQT